jgi:hypothetical protein
VLVLIIACFFPSFLLAERRITDPYFNTVISQVMAGFEDGKLTPVMGGETVVSDPYELGHLAYPTVLLTIAKICGVSPKYVQFLPIGGLLVPLLMFVLLRKILRSNVLAAMFALYVAYEPMLSEGHFNTFAYAWARPLFFTFFIIIVRLLNKRTPEDILLLVLVYVGTFLIYWTTPLWMLVLWTSIFLFMTMQTWFDRHSQSHGKQSVSLVLVFGIIYLAFSRLLYQYIPTIVDAVYGGPEEAWTLFIWQIKELLWSSQEPGPYAYVGATSTNPVLGWALFARYIVLLIPIGIYIIIKMQNIVKSHSLVQAGQTRLSPLIWGGLAIVIVHVSVYALRGHISFRPVLLVFPIIGAICIEQLQVPKVLRPLFPLLLSFLAIFGFFLHYPETQKYDVESSAYWLLERAEGTKVLTDLYTSQEYLVEQIERDIWLERSVFDTIAYEFVVKGEEALISHGLPRDRWDYVIIDNDRLQHPILSGGWRLYEPLSAHFQEFRNNSSLNAVYDEGRFLIISTSVSP